MRSVCGLVCVALRGDTVQGHPPSHSRRPLRSRPRKSGTHPLRRIWWESAQVWLPAARAGPPHTRLRTRQAQPEDAKSACLYLRGLGLRAQDFTGGASSLKPQASSLKPASVSRDPRCFAGEVRHAFAEPGKPRVVGLAPLESDEDLL